MQPIPDPGDWNPPGFSAQNAGKSQKQYSVLSPNFSPVNDFGAFRVESLTTMKLPWNNVGLPANGDLSLHGKATPATDDTAGETSSERLAHSCLGLLDVASEHTPTREPPPENRQPGSGVELHIRPNSASSRLVPLRLLSGEQGSIPGHHLAGDCSESSARSSSACPGFWGLESSRFLGGKRWKSQKQELLISPQSGPCQRFERATRKTIPAICLNLAWRCSKAYSWVSSSSQHQAYKQVKFGTVTPGRGVEPQRKAGFSPEAP